MAKEHITIKDILNPNLSPVKRLIKDDQELKQVVALLKKNGYKITLTQGVWDLIHIGHAQYLEKAKAQGDILIVGVDSDQLTKKRKGPSRPIVPEDERVKMISHLRYVDLIFLRQIRHGMAGNDKVLQIVQPDVLVVSMTNKDIGEEKMKAMKQYCKKVIPLIHQATTSTTARVRKLTLDGADNLAKELQKFVDSFISRLGDDK